MVKRILKRLLFILVMILELPFTFVNILLVNILCLLFLIKIRTIDRAARRAKKLDFTLEKLEGRVEWKRKDRK